MNENSRKDDILVIHSVGVLQYCAEREREAFSGEDLEFSARRRRGAMRGRRRRVCNHMHDSPPKIGVCSPGKTTAI